MTVDGRISDEHRLRGLHIHVHSAGEGGQLNPKFANKQNIIVASIGVKKIVDVIYGSPLGLGQSI